MIGKAILIMVLMNIGFKRQASSDKTFGLSANLRTGVHEDKIYKRSFIKNSKATYSDRL